MVDTKEAQYKVDSAAAWLMDTYIGKNKNVRITGRVYAKLRAAAARAQAARKLGHVAPIKGMSAWNDGVHTKMAFECPGLEYKKGSMQQGQANSHAKGTKWWNNGLETKMSKECPGPEWVLGNLKTYEQLATTKGMRKWTNGVVDRMSVNCPGDDFTLGSMNRGKRAGSTTGTKAWNNGVITKFAKEQPGDDFILGSMQQSKNKPIPKLVKSTDKRVSPLKGKSRPSEVGKKISDSKKNVKLSDSHRESISNAKKGKPGVATTTGKKAWNNGVITKFAESQPDLNFVLGRCKRKS